MDFDVQFQNFHAIKDLITSVSALLNTSTCPVQWILKESTMDAHRSELRVQAAKNTLQKAQDYATALGFDKVTPFELQETSVHAGFSSRKFAPSRKDGSVKNVTRNLAEIEEEWDEVEEAVLQYQLEDIKMSITVDIGFYAE